MKQNRNKGYSFIELVVVMAILAILISGTVTLVLSVSSYRAKQAVRQISGALSETRVQALSKTSAWMEIKQKDDGTYVIATSYAEDVELSKAYTISYTDGDGAETLITSGETLILTYDRSTGGFSDIQSRKDDGSLTGTNKNCSKITVTKGDKAFVIQLYKESGKHTYED